MANAYVEELGHLLDRLAVTDAQQRRLFFQGQIEKVKASLAKAEATFLEVKERSGMRVTAVIAESGVLSERRAQGADRCTRGAAQSLESICNGHESRCAKDQQRALRLEGTARWARARQRQGRALGLSRAGHLRFTRHSRCKRLCSRS
jgi:hypothetical protein